MAKVKKDDPAAKAQKWLERINKVKESKQQQAFERHGEKIVKTYRNSDALQLYSNTSSNPSRVMYNVLWSNVQIQKPLLYARTPKVVVERRHKDSSPVGRLAAKICERATSFMISAHKDRFDHAVKSSVEDRLLPGRGVAFVRYDADFVDSSDNDAVSGIEKGPDVVESDEDTQEVELATERVVQPFSERVFPDYVHWTQFYHNPARNVYEWKWVAKEAHMSRGELVERFGEIGNEVELTAQAQHKNKRKDSAEDLEDCNQAIVYEIWDIETKTVIWVSEGYKDAPLDIEEDLLKLDGFWPCPAPLYATTTTDSLYPTPDYKIYEKLAEELDYVTKRISAMAECIRYVGAHAASLGSDIKNVLKLTDGQTWPIENYAMFMEKGGLAGAINWFPFDQCVAALGPLQAYHGQLLQQIDQITGIPDIVRGATDPTETAAAIQRKSKWTMLKAAEKQADVQRFCRDLISKMAQIIFEPGLFQDETIAQMCGYDMLTPEEQQMYPEALGLLRNDRLRTFRIDVETDSTIAVDEQEEQSLRMEYIQTLGQLVSSIQNVAQYRPELMQPIVQSALFAVRSFRTGRDLEGSWEQAFQAIEEADKAAKAQPPPPPPPDPAMIAAQNDSQRVQIEAQKAQSDAGLKAQELQLKSQQAQMQMELDSQKLQLEAQKNFDKSEIERVYAQLEQFKQDFAQQMEQARLELEQYATTLKEREKLIEEERLNQRETIEVVKLLQGKMEGLAAQPREAAAPVVHIHNDGSKEIEIKRDADGTLRGKSKRAEMI